METAIYYFSGTGNSLAIAKQLQKELKGSEIISIRRSLKEALFVADAHRVGFIFPNYFGRIPKLVKRFIKEVKLLNTEYVFSVVTCGGTSGKTCKEIEHLLSCKGRRLNSFCEMPVMSNYIIAPYYKMVNVQGEKKVARLDEVRKKTADIARLIDGKKNFRDTGTAMLKILSGILNIPNNMSKTEKWDTRFHVDSNCISCGTCEKICPVNNVRMINGQPAWYHKCQLCMACIQNCPKEAIQYGDKTSEMRRYRHPDVTLEELIDE